jgi:poly(3-hydroxyalkanoate) synthetase
MKGSLDAIAGGMHGAASGSADDTGGTKMTPQGDPLLWPFSGAQMALDTWLSWFGKQPEPPPNKRDEAALPWTTPHRVALELTTMQLRDFSRQRGGQPLLICAPYALHTALIADFAPEHSIIEALLRGGTRRLYVTDWRSATASMRFLSIDSYLADLNVAVDEIGPPVDLAGLCQGGWLSLVYAARFPEKVRRLVLAGAPVDVSIPSTLSQMVASLPVAAFESLVSPATGLMIGKQMQPAWSASLNAQVGDALQLSPSLTTDHDRELVERFERWDDNIVDLPGVYYVHRGRALCRARPAA